MRSGPMNYQLQMLLAELAPKARESRLWKRVIKDLMKPSRQRRCVNVYKIEKNAREGETIIVPGKVLSLGTLSKKIDVAALTFSEEAERKIKEANGKVMTIKELFDQNPEGKKVRILG
jgi:large subunit ribosomal protein L18e